MQLTQSIHNPPEPAERRFLFVNGPFGPFSRELAERLRARGAWARRVVMNGGDLWDWGFEHALFYTRPSAEYATWILAQVRIHGVTDIVTFGDSQRYARIAIEQANRLGLRVHVFEEGYFRPHWITLEAGGVNGESALPRDPELYRRIAQYTSEEVAAPVGPLLPGLFWAISLNHFITFLATPIFQRYQHPYTHYPPLQAIGHARRYFSGMSKRKKRAAAQSRLMESPGPLFLALLQRPGDSQLTRYSSFDDVGAFAAHVLESFKAHAPSDARLIFKAHPLDHGLEDHEGDILGRAEALGLKGRVFYLQEGHLATLLRACGGVISVNSTGGLTAVEFGAPSIVLGDAIYDMAGLTHQAGLDAFWTAPERPDPELYKAFRRVVMAATQINGGYATAYSRKLALTEAAKRLLDDAGARRFEFMAPARRRMAEVQ